MNLLLRLSSSSSSASSYYHSPSLFSSSQRSCKKAFFHHYFRHQKKKNDVTTVAAAAATTTTTTTISSCCSLLKNHHHHHHHQNNNIMTKRTHYSYSGPGSFGLRDDGDDDHHDHHHRHNWYERGYTVGIGGPVGSGKTALVLSLTKLLTSSKVKLGVVTNDIFTQEDAQFLSRNNALPDHLIRAVETGGCPHAAIREDVSSNLTACEDLTKILLLEEKEESKSNNNENNNNNNNTNNQQQSLSQSSIPMILCESGGDNLAANFSRELADLTLYVIDVAGGDKVPRKGGPGITQSDLLIINKIDLAEAVGSDLDVMERDANKMRRKTKIMNDHDTTTTGGTLFGPTIFTSVKHGTGIEDIKNFILKEYHAATTTTSTSTNDD